jgi:hypothetical protein
MPKRNPWCRLYASIRSDPKIRKITCKHFQIWTFFLTIASENNGEIDEPFAHVFCGFSATVIRKAIAELLAVGLLDPTEKPHVFKPHKWDEYQYTSDLSTPRVQRFRERHGGVTNGVTEPFPETDQSRADRVLDFPPSEKSKTLGRIPPKVSVRKPRGNRSLTRDAPASDSHAVLPNGQEEEQPRRRSHIMTRVEMDEERRLYKLDPRKAEEFAEACTRRHLEADKDNSYGYR